MQYRLNEAQRREIFKASKGGAPNLLPRQSRRAAGSTGSASCPAEPGRRFDAETELRARAAQRTADARREAAELRTELEELRTELGELRTELEELRSKALDSHAEAELLRERLERTTAERDAVLSSTFWRMTWPVRRIAASLPQPLRRSARRVAAIGLRIIRLPFAGP
jgi:DNA repair exonuclease SbcCD ATPase subunit